MSTEQQDDSPTPRYYLTTAIDYPNAPPHIGHALEKVAADVVARYHRLLGHDTFFSIGLDENSQHVSRAAETNQATPKEWVDRMDEAFRKAWSHLNLSFDYFMRTTEPRHFRASQEMFRRARDKGDIYKATYSGWFCPNCNNFYTTEELLGGRCPNHPTISPEWLEEENYFFALSKYGERLLQHIEANPDFIVPASRKAELIGLIKQGLRDFSVSRQVRPGTDWGVPVPDDPKHVLYVWFDALTNYVTAVGFPDDHEKFDRYWPADAHVIGKDITRFHCLYWPAMLLSADLQLPRQVAVHGFLTLEGQKISKTLGNIIDPVEITEKIGSDPVRYYMLRNLSFSSDGDFSRTGLLRHYHDELGNDLGNLLNRVVSMIKRYRGSVVPTPKVHGPLEEDLQRVARESAEKARTSLESWDIGGSLNHIWNFVRRANQYIEQSEPWKLAKQADKEAELDTVLYSAAESARLLAIFLAPYIPTSCDRILQQLALGPVEHGDWLKKGQWGSIPLTSVVPGPVLFPRIESPADIGL